MKTKLLALVVVFLLAGASAFAADGDLIVSGNMAVGTAAPWSKLHVKGNAAELLMESTGTDAAEFRFYNSYGANQTWSMKNRNEDGRFAIYAGADLVGNEIFTIRPNGSVGIWNTNPSYTLDVNGDVYAAGGWAGSDIRWKKNIMPLENSLENVLKLQGVNFEWRVDEYKYKNFSEGKQVGLIAQEVEKVIPELVHADNEGYKAVSYEKLTAVLIEAIKEQQKKIAELENRIKMLEK